VSRGKLTDDYGLNIEKGAANEGKVWIAGARVLGLDNQVEDERLFSLVLRDLPARVQR
jgi:hypothetical protein